MRVLSHRFTIVAEFMMLVLMLAIIGCGGGDGDNENATISGQMNLPSNAIALGGGGAPVANTGFVVSNLEQPNASSPTRFQSIGSGTTDSTGKYQSTVPQTSAALVIANGSQPSGPQQNKIVPVSGLMNLNQDTLSKNFDGTTTIACFAGWSAILDGPTNGGITAQQLTAQRISNLESAAAPLVATTDFTNLDPTVPNSLLFSANRVRVLTDNGAHP